MSDKGETTEGVYRRLVGARILMLRKSQGMRQDDLAERAQVTRNFISAIENGVQSIDAWRMIRIADALKIPISVLLSPRPESLSELLAEWEQYEKWRVVSSRSA